MIRRTAMAVSVALLTASAQVDAAAIPGTFFKQRTCGSSFSSLFGLLEAVGLTSDQKLVCFPVTSPTSTRSMGNVTGLSGDTKIVGIDFRPADGDLYGLGDAGGIYTIDIDSAEATFKSQMNVVLEGAFFGIDFNPTVDRLRIISDTGQNLRVNVDTGGTTEDIDLVYPGAMPVPGIGVAGAAYTNNDRVGDTATTLFDVDSMLDQIVIQAPPNNGVLSATGKLLADTSADIGFDIYSTVRSDRAVDNVAYASLTVAGRARLYRVNLLTGRALPIGAFLTNVVVTDIALPQEQF